MKRIALKSFLTAMVIVCAAGMAFSAPMEIKVKNVKGVVEAQTGAAWTRLKDGDSAPAGTTLRTGPESSCLLVWAAGNTAKLGPLTKMKVASAEKDSSGKENSAFELSAGKMTAHAKKLPTKSSSFTVKTPTAIAGVRGTEPIVEVTSDGLSRFSVADGSIDVSSGNEAVVVEEGFFVEVDMSGAIPEPEIIPAGAMEEYKEDLKEVAEEASLSAGETEAESGNEIDGGILNDADGGSVEDDAAAGVSNALDANQVNELTDSAQDAAGRIFETGNLETTIYFGD